MKWNHTVLSPDPKLSPSVRRAWIEINANLSDLKIGSVALREEGVD